MRLDILEANVLKVSYNLSQRQKDRSVSFGDVLIT